MKGCERMVYITGDIHGDVQHIRNAIAKYTITENDIIVILGDVGMNYYGRHGDRQRKKKLNKLGVPILCIHGNHEMRPFTIPSYLHTSFCFSQSTCSPVADYRLSLYFILKFYCIDKHK